MTFKLSFLLSLAILMSLSAVDYSKAAAQAPVIQDEIIEDFSGLSPDQVRTRILDTCVIRQAEYAKGPEDGFATRCACYAGRIVKSMTQDELQYLRSTGTFNPSAQAKAQNALQTCNVRR